MATYSVRTSPPLRGEAIIHTAKNSVLPILAASLLTSDPVSVLGTPRLTDVDTLCELLRSCGCQVEWDDSGPVGRASAPALNLCARELCMPANDEPMRRMRASILIMGPLLARLGMARVTLPGGCAIGQRPVDQHIKGMQALGAEVALHQGHIELSGRLRGGSVYLDMPSVGATENIMMAATLAQGASRIENAAKEPEITDLAMCLNQMGARVAGAGSGTIIVQGVAKLHGVKYQPIPDRIEAGTLACATAIAGGNVLLRGARSEHMRALLFKLQEAGVIIAEQREGLRVRGKAVQPLAVRTMVYPGFPTDLQAPIMAVACFTPGTSVFLETVFENRYMHATELRRMGARIRVEDRVALIDGGPDMHGTRVISSDLRAGASLICAAVGAKGETIVEDPQGHIDRGYERIERTLGDLGAPIRRLQPDPPA
ncbi:MAG: UDP-N-acetylglucosamine 1-carboxyvinyltransferase [Oscillospiraceae bacterium]|jgi:UDP-N-acetylglucosamine 1-carboxyvinyltransferase|nr:UDP-N-acetylglucosamine 1-carboxyvinyltransferase [Oscillospiraceae bacterium]